MSKSTLGAVGAIVLLAGAAHAAPFEFCKDYANEAAQQYYTMRSTPGCVRPPNNQWHPDRKLHFSWCVSAPIGLVNVERHARDNQMSACDPGYGG